MSIIGLLLVLVVCGFVVFFIDRYVPMSPPFKTLFYGIVVIVLVLWLLNVTGLYHTNLHLR